MSKPILSVKLKNAITQQAAGMNLQFTLKNISVNGEKLGCSGFVRNLDNGSVVYVTTEKFGYAPLTYMYRRVKDEKEFHGERNRWTQKRDLSELASCVCKMLADPEYLW